jgi:hypothetical protein
MTVPDLSSDPVTVDSVNAILFDGTNKQLSTSIVYLSGVMGIYPALKRTNWAGTEFYSLVLHDLKFVLNWDDESIQALGQTYTASMAYEALLDAVTGVPDPGGGAGRMEWYGKAGGNDAKMRAKLRDLSNQIESVANSYLQSCLYALGLLFSDDIGITAWVTEPYLTREEMGVITNPGKYVGMGPDYGGMNNAANDRAYYTKLLIWYVNKGVNIPRRIDSLLQFAASPSLTGLRLNRFGDWTLGLSKWFFKSQFTQKLAESLYPMMQRGSFLNYVATGTLFASLGGIASLFAVFYGGWGWPEAAAALVQLTAATFRAFRSRGRVVAADLRTQDLIGRVRAAELALERNVAAATDLPVPKDTLIAIMKEAFDRYLGNAIRSAIQSSVETVATNEALSNLLNGLGLRTYTMGANRADIVARFKSTLIALRVPSATVESVMRDMTGDGGVFSFYRSDDTVSDVLYNALDANQAAIKARLSSYLAYKSKLPNLNSRLTVAEEALRQFTQRFGENTKPGRVFLRMNIEDRTRWSILFSVLFGLTPEQVAKVWAYEDEIPQQPPETIIGETGDGSRPGEEGTAFAVSIPTPQYTDAPPSITLEAALELLQDNTNSVEQITRSGAPDSYKWVLVKYRRKSLRALWFAVFVGLGIPESDATQALNFLTPTFVDASKNVNEYSGIRTNGAHGVYPRLDQFFTRNRNVINKDFASRSPQIRVKYAAVFFSRFFGLRGKYYAKDLFALSTTELSQAAQLSRIAIDVLQMDATHSDGQPPAQMPTAADLRGYRTGPDDFTNKIIVN